MSKQNRTRTRPAPSNPIREGADAFAAGRFHLAVEAFTKAHHAEPRHAEPLLYLARANELTGDIDAAAVNYTRALKLRPGWLEVAQRLSLLLARYVLPTPGMLDPHGLLAAFAFPQIDHQPLAAAAIAHLQAHGALGGAVRQAAEGHATDAARALLLKRTEKTLAHPLLHAALTQAANHDAAVEKLLTAMRRVLLLEVAPSRLEDKALMTFALALVQQCLNNEHIFAAQADEKAALAQLAIDWEGLKATGRTATRALLLHLLYAPPYAVIGDNLSTEECRALRPRALADIITARLDEDATLKVRADEITVLSTVQDETSERVARQYEAHPYPRWTSLLLPPANSARRTLERYFPPERVDFLNAPYKVLIAGAGTGQHAIAAAARYGEHADVLAIDLSRPSLAYGQVKAAQLELTNLWFAQADIAALTPEAVGQFDVIEAVGVLHHLADPFAGWRTLAGLLLPGGVMAVGLYSATARRQIAELRAAADYPGPGCSDDAARDYRMALMADMDRLGRLARSHDFYALSDFRDLLLHEHERPVTLSEIEAFLAANGLVFRGFSMPQPLESAFHAMFPDDRWPGTLANWATFEEKHPRAFETMYQFWCERA